jgi:endonuclease/exonuclease/phosphatase family metal-dependent hydrolase
VLQLDPLAVNADGRSTHLFSRPPLMAKFTINGREHARGVKEITVIGAHFTSKLGQEDAARKRFAQAQVVANFAQGLTSLDPTAAVVVSGDLNMEREEPEFAPLRSAQHGARLVNVAQQVRASDRFSWRDGRKNLMLDHMLASSGFADRIAQVLIPHISTQMEKGAATDPVRAEGVSDHDPMVATINL